MSKILGAQLYTIRNFAATPEELDQSLSRIKAMGYRTVQVSAMWHLSVDEIAAIVASHGLQTVITHTPYERFIDDLDGVIRDHHKLGCSLAGLGGLPKKYQSKDGYVAFAKKFSTIADELAQNGLKFSYHNHHFEFQKYGGQLGLDILIEQTNPDNFLFTLDTYWVQVGGGNPSNWIRKLKNRIEAIHLKDLAIIDSQQIMAEVMEGNLDWPEILQACEEAGVKWYLIERDDGPTDAFDSLKISYDHLRKLGYE